jgi:lipoprotein signal peptidase
MADVNLPERSGYKGVVLRSAAVIAATVAFTAADQISKAWALREFMGGRPHGQAGDFLRFTCHMNKGTAWGFCSGGHWYGLPTVIVVIGMVIGAVMALASTHPREGSVLAAVVGQFRSVTAGAPAAKTRSAAASAMLDAAAFAMLISGALGNALDRFQRGSVIDFIDVGIGTTRWPTFNIADACLVVGIYLVLTGALADLAPRQDEHSDPGPKPASALGLFAGVVATAALAAVVMAAIGRACETSLAVHNAVVAVLSWLGIVVVAVLLFGYVRLEMRRMRRQGGGDPPPQAET